MKYLTQSLCLVIVLAANYLCGMQRAAYTEQQKKHLMMSVAFGCHVMSDMLLKYGMHIDSKNPGMRIVSWIMPLSALLYGDIAAMEKNWFILLPGFFLAYIGMNEVFSPQALIKMCDIACIAAIYSTIEFFYLFKDVLPPVPLINQNRARQGAL